MHDVILHKIKSSSNNVDVMRGRSKVRSPGFEPGSSAWEADVLARLYKDRANRQLDKQMIT
jgi:hypothetical protein